MARVWDVLENQRSRIYEEDGLITVTVHAIALRREEVLRLAKALLQAARASTIEAAMLAASEEPGSVPYAGYGDRYALDLEQVMRRAEEQRGLGHHDDDEGT